MNHTLASAVPNDSTGYVFAAFAFVFLMLLIYLWILGAKFQRLNREVDRLTAELEASRAESGTEAAGQSATVEAGSGT